MADTTFKLVHVRGGPSSVPEVLLESQSVTIGRSGNNRLILQDTKTSRYHAEVYRVSSDWLIKDLESANGVRVNGVKVVTRVLAADDLISIGETDFRFERCTPSDLLRLTVMPPPPPPPDPNGLGNRRTGRTPALTDAQISASQDREPIGAIVPSQQNNAELESTLQPNRLVAPWAQAPQSPAAAPAPGAQPPGATGFVPPGVAPQAPVAPFPDFPVPPAAASQPTMFVKAPGVSPVASGFAPASPPTTPGPLGGAPIPSIGSSTLPPASQPTTGAPSPAGTSTPYPSGRLELLEPPRLVPPGIEIAGMEAFSEYIVRRTAAFAPAEGPRLPQPNAVALVGPAGCGKATAARFAAARWGLLYARLNLAFLLAGPAAQWTATLADALGRASSGGATVLAIEDVDALDDRFDALGDEARRAWAAVLELLTAWLRAKDGAPVVFLTARDPRKLPPALVTRGDSVDEVFFVDLPGHRERLHLVEHGLKLRGLTSGSVDPDVLVDITAGYSTAQVQRALEDALFAAQGRDVTTVDLAEAVKRGRPAGQRLGSRLDDLREWARKEARWAT